MHYLLAAFAVLIAVLAAGGAFTASVILSEEFPAAMYITPVTASVEKGDTQSFNIEVESTVQVNSFAGEIIFDTEKFAVVDISYNTEVANLWVTEPWYNRAENSIYFAGGTTQSGGFIGRDSLITVTLQAIQAGEASFSLHNARILAHDGLGRDVPLTTPLDALFIVDVTPYTVPISDPLNNFVVVVEELPPLDINQDGELDFRDISAILFSIGTNEARYDFTADGKVSWADVREWQRLRGKE